MAHTYAAYYNDLGLPGSPFEDGAVLVWYDGPRLLWFATADGRRLLIESADESADGCLELAVYLSPEELQTYLDGERQLRDAWTSAAPGNVYGIRSVVSGNVDKITAAPYMVHITDDLLPAIGFNL